MGKISGVIEILETKYHHHFIIIIIIIIIIIMIFSVTHVEFELQEKVKQEDKAPYPQELEVQESTTARFKDKTQNNW